MSRAEGDGKLKEKDWNRLQEIVERFETDCAKKSNRRLKDYIPPINDPIHERALEEVICTDMEIRSGRRQPVLIDIYFGEFPKLRELPCFPKLLVEEFRLRRQAGDHPHQIEFKSRYPEKYDEFRRLLTDVNGYSSVAMPIERTPAVAQPVPHDATPPVKVDTGKMAARHDEATVVRPPIDKSMSVSSDSVLSMSGPIKKIRKIGRGGFGVVWEARAMGGVPIAVKIIYGTVSPKAMERERESLDLISRGKLRHPFLLQVLFWWVQEDRIHIAMELADCSLEDKLNEAKKAGQTGLSRSELKQVMVDAAAALDFLNFEKNILHRDVKPANMLLMANRLKLADFGLSRMTENLALAAGRTMGAGTPVFMSPEIINGMQSSHSDQYSLASTYYMLRTAQTVFKGTVAEIRRHHVSTIPKLESPNLTDGERRVLQKALSKSPDDRYPTSTKFVEALFSEPDGEPGRQRRDFSTKAMDMTPIVDGPPKQKVEDEEPTKRLPSLQAAAPVTPKMEPAPEAAPARVERPASGTVGWAPDVDLPNPQKPEPKPAAKTEEQAKQEDTWSTFRVPDEPIPVQSKPEPAPRLDQGVAPSAPAVLGFDEDSGDWANLAKPQPAAAELVTSPKPLAPPGPTDDEKPKPAATPVVADVEPPAPPEPRIKKAAIRLEGSAAQWGLSLRAEKRPLDEVANEGEATDLGSIEELPRVPPPVKPRGNQTISISSREIDVEVEAEFRGLLHGKASPAAEPKREEPGPSPSRPAINPVKEAPPARSDEPASPPAPPSAPVVPRRRVATLVEEPIDAQGFEAVRPKAPESPPPVRAEEPAKKAKMVARGESKEEPFKVPVARPVAPPPPPAKKLAPTVANKPVASPQMVSKRERPGSRNSSQATSNSTRDDKPKEGGLGLLGIIFIGVAAWVLFALILFFATGSSGETHPETESGKTIAK